MVKRECTGGGGADNLGNHTATSNLNMAGYAISGVSGVFMSAPPVDNTEDVLLAWDSSTGRIEQRTVASLGVGGDNGTVYIVQGQVGTLFADGLMQNQPRYVVPSGYTLSMFDAYITLGKAGTTQTSLQASILSHNTDGTAPTPGSPSSTLNVASGLVYYPWTAMASQVLTSQQHLQTRVDVAGSGATSLAIHFYGTLTLD